jgi:hypothetical protein
MNVLTGTYYWNIQGTGMSYVTFQVNSEIWSDKTGGHIIQVIGLIEVVTKAGLTVT